MRDDMAHPRGLLARAGDEREHAVPRLGPSRLSFRRVGVRFVRHGASHDELKMCVAFETLLWETLEPRPASRSSMEQMADRDATGCGYPKRCCRRLNS